MEEEIPPEIVDIQEITGDIPEEEADSYDELAKGAEVAEPPKRGRGRPKGAKNKVKPPPPSESESEEEEPPPPPPRRKKPKAPVAPVRIKKTPATGRSLMDVVAEAAQQHGVRERDRRRNFYESFLPM